jgi:Outer membrane lipoprotein-sorting protein
MKCAVALLFSLLALTTVQAAETKPPTAPLSLIDIDRDGQELAAKLRDASPDGDSSFSGVFEITAKDDSVRRVPITSQIAVTTTNWIVTYRSVSTNGAPAETLTITHAVGQPSRYEYSVGTNRVAAVPMHAPFAGSDFWLIDLGLEFFHWPKQRRLRHEMSNSRSCYVLESLTATATAAGYARVLSWVDIEYGGIIRAEAYDRAGRLVKEFKVGRFRKVEGRWQLESMIIRSRATGQETELKFDLQKR